MQSLIHFQGEALGKHASKTTISKRSGHRDHAEGAPKSEIFYDKRGDDIVCEITMRLSDMDVRSFGRGATQKLAKREAERNMRERLALPTSKLCELSGNQT